MDDEEKTNLKEGVELQTLFPDEVGYAAGIINILSRYQKIKLIPNIEKTTDEKGIKNIEKIYDELLKHDDGLLYGEVLGFAKFFSIGGHLADYMIFTFSGISFIENMGSKYFMNYKDFTNIDQIPISKDYRKYLSDEIEIDDLTGLLSSLKAFAAQKQDSECIRPTGIIPKIELPKKCKIIINSCVASTAGIGAIPIGVADSALITPIQVAMVISIGVEFGELLSKEQAMSLLKVYTGMLVGRNVSKMVGSFIPVVGWIANAGIDGVITKIMGENVAKTFYIKNLQKNILQKEEGTRRGYKYADLAEENTILTDTDKFETGDKNSNSDAGSFLDVYDKCENYITNLEKQKDLTEADRTSLRKIKSCKEKLSKMIQIDHEFIKHVDDEVGYFCHGDRNITDDLKDFTTLKMQIEDFIKYLNRFKTMLDDATELITKFEKNKKLIDSIAKKKTDK